MQQPQVWLVEDEQGIADTLIYTLQLEGFTVELFARGLPALEKARQQRPDAVILAGMTSGLRCADSMAPAARQKMLPIPIAP